MNRSGDPAIESERHDPPPVAIEGSQNPLVQQSSGGPMVGALSRYMKKQHDRPNPTENGAHADGNPPDTTMSTADAAAALSTSVSTIRRLIKSGSLPATIVRGDFRVHASAVAALTDRAVR